MVRHRRGGPHSIAPTAEIRRLEEARHGAPWRRWGPYVSERQWGTVREDYSADGDAWEYFPHDHARSRAYRWGEDGIGGFGEEHLYLCLGVALWNEQTGWTGLTALLLQMRSAARTKASADGEVSPHDRIAAAD